MALILPPTPASLKQIQHYLKAASEHEVRDRVVSYWCRLYALQTALKIDKKSDDAKKLLEKLMDWLEVEKKNQCDNEAITNDIAAQAHIENYSLKLFMWADGQDRTGVFNKNVVKSFYTAGVLMDVLNLFGELSEDIAANCKYAKWKAAYIHNCLKNGETPIPGPISGEGDDVAPGGSDDGAAGMGSMNTGGVYDIRDNTNENQERPSFQPPPNINIPLNPPQVPEDLAATPPTSINCNYPIPNANNISTSDYAPSTSSGVKLDPAQITKAQKYCKFASSALNYEDVGDAINYLRKALLLLEEGLDS